MCKVCNRTIRRPTNDSQKAETGMVRPCRKINRTYQGDPARHSERRQKERETEKEMGGQHKGLDRPKNIRVIENSGEQRGMEKTDCQILSGAPTDKGLRDWKWKWRPWHRMLGMNLPTYLLFVAVVQISSVTPVIHTLNYFTTVSQVAKLPEFLEVAYVDGVQILQFDSNHRETKAKHDWVNKITEDNPYFWETETAINIMNEQMMKRNIETAKKRFNQTGGVHMIQVMKGCEWDDETDEVNGWEHYRYDGEDFLAFEAKTMTWIAAHPQAFTTKIKLDQIDRLNEDKKIMQTEVCPELLKKHLRNGRVFLTRTELPKVSLLQKTPSSPVTCHATGFYPITSSLFWRKNGEEIHEDVEMGATLPNHDGTFQTSVDLKAEVTPAAEQEYECVFQLDGVPQDIVIKLDAGSILNNARIQEEEDWKKAEDIAVPLVFLSLVVVVGLTIFLLLKIKQACKKKEEDDAMIQETAACTT